MTRAFTRGNVKLGWYEKWKKKYVGVFLPKKYSKLGSISLKHFVEPKPIISEECIPKIMCIVHVAQTVSY